VPASRSSKDTAEEGASSRSLAERLLEVRAGIAQYVRPENQQVNERTIEWLRSSGAAERALKRGDEAPSFTLMDQADRSVASEGLLAAGPLIVTFFRGRWCPFCVATLEAWRNSHAQVLERGAQFVAISPQTAHHNSLTSDQHKLHYRLLSDGGNEVAKKFGVAYRVPEEQVTLYRSSFVNLPHLNGDESWMLPLAATFVISHSGKIAAAFVSPDHRERAEPADVLAAL
jgi:peroxiredoxin